MRTIYRLETGVTRIRSKAAQLTNKFTFGVAAGVAGLGLALIPLASAATTVVTPSNPQGWYIQAGTGGTVEYVASPGALGTGAVQFSTATDSDYTRFKNDINVPLSSITTLSYKTHQVSAPADAKVDAAVNLRLYIDSNGDGIFNDVLVYEPYYNAPVSSTGWQIWNITQTSGYWWSNSHLTYHGNPTTGAGDANNITLSDVLNDYPSTTVLSIGLGTGDSNSPWVVQADALTVNSTTYNFENEASNKDLCKNDGWKTGGNFKNQGACVSYFASDGKSQH